jgi:acyl dehydratase
MAGAASVERFFDEYEVGEAFTGMARTIDQSDVNLFAGLTMDLHPAHLDASFAGERYGGRLVHGMLTFSIVTGLTVEYNLRAVSYGYDRVRFPAPVHAGDTVRGRSEVVELREHRRPELGVVVKEYQGRNQHGAVVFACRHLLAVERRAAA